MNKKPYNLSKIARRDPPTAFNPYAPERLRPYRDNIGPGQEQTVDLLRAGNQPSAINPSSGGGEGWSTNKAYPSTDTPLIQNFDGRPNEIHGEGIVTQYGLAFHDDYEGQSGDSSGESALGIASTLSRIIDDNQRDRAPYNANQFMQSSVLRKIRSRISSL